MSARSVPAAGGISDRAAFEDEKRRLESFGVGFVFRDDTARIVGDEAHFYDIEQWRDDSTFVVRLNPSLTWRMLSVALHCAWESIADRSACEALNWQDRGEYRDTYFSVGDKFWDIHGPSVCRGADTWAECWGILEGTS